MGTTNRPLVIWVQEKWMSRKEVKALIEKGHTVFSLTGVGNLPEPDLIIHENAWRWRDAYWEHIEVALKEARKGQTAKRATGDEAASKPRRGKRPKPAAAE